MQSKQNILEAFILSILIIIISAYILQQIYPKQAEQEQPNYLSFAKRFLDTKTTNENGLACGPPDDWDCGFSEYQDFAISANVQYYELTGDEKYLNYAINFANTRPTSPPPYCPNCICSMLDDADCGDVETQVNTIFAFSELYAATKNKNYLDFAEKVAETKQSVPQNVSQKCTCEPPYNLNCCDIPFLSGFYDSYELLYNLTNNTKYKTYTENILNEFQRKLSEQRGNEMPYIFFYIHMYSTTKNSTYLEIAKEEATRLLTHDYPCGQLEKWQCPANDTFHQSKLILIYAALYNHTGEKKFLDIAVKFADTGGVDCGPNIGWVCNAHASQARMIFAYYTMYKITGDEKYSYYLNNFISPESFDRLNCADFNCHQAAVNYIFETTFMELT